MPSPDATPRPARRRRRALADGVGRRTGLAILLIAAVVGFGVIAIVRNSVGRDWDNGSFEVDGPVGWSLVGAGPEGRSVVVHVLTTHGDCQFPWATASVPAPDIRIRASVRARACGEVRNLAAYFGGSVTVPIPGGGLAGQAISGPGYAGVASRDRLAQLTARSGRGSYPSVAGLRWSDAREILTRTGAAVRAVGPTTATAFVRTQWPPPGSPFALDPEPSALPRRGERSEARRRRTIGLAAVPPALLLTGAPGDGVTAGNLPRSYVIACRDVRSFHLTAAERRDLGRQIPTTCGGQDTR